MSQLLIGLVSALVATNTPAAVSNLVEQTTGISVKVPDPNDPVEKEFKKLEEQDDHVMAEVDGWIRENKEFAAKGAGIPDSELNLRIRKRLDSVQKDYEDFLKRHPGHVAARIAYASFLGDLGNEEDAIDQLEKARELDPRDPAIWNNLANHYGHIGPVKKAFEYYEKAITLDPNESVYYHNFGTTVYLFRKDANEYYGLNESQIFDKAFALYSNSLRLEPANFPLASDVAQTYYGIRPLRTNDALRAWTNALAIAGDEIEREGVYLHFARIKGMAGRFDEARVHLNAVTNPMYAELKKRITRTLDERQSGTNNAAASAPDTAAPVRSALPASADHPPAKNP